MVAAWQCPRGIAGVSPAPVTVCHGPGVEPSRQAGEAFYFAKQGYSPDIGDYGLVNHESEAAAHKHFEKECLIKSDYSEVDESKVCKISGVQHHFRDYW